MIRIRVYNYLDNFINKILKNNIKLYKIKYYNDYLEANIYENDLEKVYNLCYIQKIEIISYLGIKGLFLHIKKYIFDYILLLIILVIMFFVSNFIIDIELVHENSKLKSILLSELDEYGIKEFTIRKNFKKLKEIEDNIKLNNKDLIEFISIKRDGMKYIVYVEERIKNNLPNEYSYCDIISSKNAVINSIIAESGDILKKHNEYVTEGEVIISGSISHNDEIKGLICAKAKVMGNTWYKVNVKYPLEYDKKEYTDKKRLNLKYNNNSFLKKKFDYYEEIKIFGIGPFKLVKEQEYKIIQKKLDYKKARHEAINEAIKKIKEKNPDNFKVISKKVLKEEKNNSTIELDIFVSVIERIDKQIIY